MDLSATLGHTTLGGSQRPYNPFSEAHNMMPHPRRCPTVRGHLRAVGGYAQRRFRCCLCKGIAYRRLHCLRFAYRLTLRQRSLRGWRHRRRDKREVFIQESPAVVTDVDVFSGEIRDFSRGMLAGFLFFRWQQSERSACFILLVQKRRLFRWFWPTRVVVLSDQGG